MSDKLEMYGLKVLLTPETMPVGVYEGEWQGYNIYFDHDGKKYEGSVMRCMQGTAKVRITVTRESGMSKVEVIKE